MSNFKKTAKKISEDFRAAFAVRQLMNYMKELSLPVSYGVKAWQRWGEPAAEMIKRNPYMLCSFGIDLPFAKADEIAELAKEEGTLLLRDNVSKLVQEGRTSMEELIRVTYAV